MSYQLKKHRLEEISDILSSRCKTNSELYFVLMKEKEKLEKQLSTSNGHKHERQKIDDHSKSKGKQEKINVRKLNSDDTTSVSVHSNSASHKLKAHKTPPTKKRTKHRSGLQTQNKLSAKLPNHHQGNSPTPNDIDSIKPSQKKLRTDALSTKKIAFDTSADKVADVHDKYEKFTANHKQSDKTANVQSLNGSNLIKTFTKEEIQQMSTHNKKKMPNYINPPHYPQAMNKKVSKANEKSMPRKASREDSMESLEKRALANKSKASSAYSSQTSISREIVAVKMPVVTSSRFSPSLLKLQEEKRKRPNNKRSTKSIYNYGISGNNPAQKEAMEKPTVTENCNFNTKENGSNLSISTNSEPYQFQGETKVLKGKVVFTFDMDDLQQKEKKGLSFFRRKIFRKKTSTKTTNVATQTEQSMKSQMVQSIPCSIPGLLNTKHTQTSCATQSISVQTREANPQNKENQTYPNAMPISAQTTSDASLHNRPQVSLDDLVQHRKQRRAKSVINRKSQAEDEITGRLQRSATVQARSKENTERKSKVLNAYNWSQTDKFIKVIISHNGVHLIPINQIQVKSNGVNLKLLIEEKEPQQEGNSNQNNNNDNASTIHKLFIDRLCHPVVNLSYTIQPDMVAVLLRKKTEKTWNQLQKPINHRTPAPQVYL